MCIRASVCVWVFYILLKWLVASSKIKDANAIELNWKPPSVWPFHSRKQSRSSVCQRVCRKKCDWIQLNRFIWEKLHLCNLWLAYIQCAMVSLKIMYDITLHTHSHTSFHFHYNKTRIRFVCLPIIPMDESKLNNVLIEKLLVRSWIGK